MKNLFLPKDISLRLRKLGYPMCLDKSLACYDGGDVMLLIGCSKNFLKHLQFYDLTSDPYLYAPTYHQVIDWFETKGLFISIQYAAPDTNMFSYRIDYSKDEVYIYENSGWKYITREDCTKAAILTALNLLENDKH